MEEGEFVKWKQIVVGLISIMMIFTSVRGEVNENQRSNYQMLEQIEKSYVVDSGFRESNYFFLDMVDSYATYYLQCIKQLIGEEDSVERTDVSYEINCLSNKAVDQWNLLDVYSLIMLVDDVKQIPETFTGTNVAGASYSSFKISSSGTLRVSFVDGADIYKGNIVYRPMATIYYGI